MNKLELRQIFRWNAKCSKQHLHPAPGEKPSWKPWLRRQKRNFFGLGNKKYQGCYQLGAIDTWNNDQLEVGTNSDGIPWTTIQQQRKQAQIDWAGCMMNICRVQGSTHTGC